MYSKEIAEGVEHEIIFMWTFVRKFPIYSNGYMQGCVQW